MAFDGNGTARLNYGDLRLADGLGQATFGGWFNSPTPLTEGSSFGESQASAGYNNLWLLGWDPAASSAKFRVISTGDGATSGGILTYSSATYNANTWYHVVARVDYDAAIDHMLRLYVNGSSVGNTSVSTKDPFTSGMGATSGMIIGGFKDEGQGDDSYEDVRHVHMFFYDTCLTDAQILELSKGRSPLQVRPQNLTFYAPVTDDTSICDVVGGVVPTVNGTGGDYLYANPSPHFYPSAQIIPFASAKGKVWVNDAPTKDGGEVLQGYPGTWTDTTLTLNQVIDQTGLSGQIYVGVETASGQIAWRAITISSGSYTIYNNYYRQLLAGNV